MLIYELADKGHNVTVLSTDVEKSRSPNVHFLHMDRVYEQLYGTESVFDIIEMSKMGSVNTLMMVLRFGPTVSECM